MSFLKCSAVDLIDVFFEAGNASDFAKDYSRLGFDKTLIDKDKIQSDYRKRKCPHCGYKYQAREGHDEMCPLCGMARANPNKDKVLLKQKEKDISNLEKKVKDLTKKAKEKAEDNA